MNNRDVIGRSRQKTTTLRQRSSVKAGDNGVHGLMEVEIRLWDKMGQGQGVKGRGTWRAKWPALFSRFQAPQLVASRADGPVIQRCVCRNRHSTCCAPVMGTPHGNGITYEFSSTGDVLFP